MSLLDEIEVRAIVAQRNAARAAAESRSAVALYEKIRNQPRRRSLYDAAIGDDAPSATASVSAGLGATASISDPNTAIAQGEQLFNKAFSGSDGSFTGVAALASGLIADLPKGQFTTMLSKVAVIGESALAGAAIGSSVGPMGTAAGAVVGAIIGFVDDLLSSPPQPPEGEFRTRWEKYVFPAIPNWTPTNATDVDNLLMQKVCQPACWPDIRTKTVGFQVPFQGNDQATNQSTMMQFNFATGWIPAPNSTPQSSGAAWFIAQAWIGQNAVSKAVITKSGNVQAIQAVANSAYQKAITVLGSASAVSRIMAILNSWFGQNFSLNWNPATSGPVDIAGYYKTPNDLAGFSKTAKNVNRSYPLDFIYYWSPDSAYNGAITPPVGAARYILPISIAGTQATFVAMPDTSIIGLAEIACLIELGVIPAHGADFVALHYMMALAFLWRRGQIESGPSGDRTFMEPVYNNHNFMRVIGIIRAKIRINSGISLNAGLTSGGNSAIVSSRVTGRASSWWKWLLGLMAVGGITLWSRRK